MIIPVSGSVPTASVGGSVPIRPQTASLTLPASALPPGVLSNTQPGSVVMIPAHYMSQVRVKVKIDFLKVRMMSKRLLTY